MIPWLDHQSWEQRSGFCLGNTCWRHQWLHNHLQKSLLFWLSGQCFLAPPNKLTVDVQGSIWLGPGDCWGHRGYTLPPPHVFTQSPLKGSEVRIPLWATGLWHPLLALLPLAHLVQTGPSKSGALLALHTSTFVGQIKK